MIRLGTYINAEGDAPMRRGQLYELSDWRSVSLNFYDCMVHAYSETTLCNRYCSVSRLKVENDNSLIGSVALQMPPLVGRRFSDYPDKIVHCTIPRVP